MIHLDLFSGIGGFAYAVDQVWDDAEHIFCDFDPFCQQVLKKHWPESEIISDIKDITNAKLKGLERADRSKPRVNLPARRDRGTQINLLTGGFPCQPFSAAGVRRGTADERYLWPEMLRVIRLTKPEWVIAENVRGLLTWNEGLVFEQVCTDMETSGYEVWPFIIPAIAVNAPHRRDRIWWVARNTEHARPDETQDPEGSTQRSHSNPQRPNQNEQSTRPDWSRHWLEVATELCSVDDGLPVELGESKLSKARHRKEQIKAYGNAIVPAVAMEIMRGIALSQSKV